MPRSSFEPTNPSAGASRPVRVAVDAMGGDHAPAEPVRGALEAVRRAGGQLEVLLVGREPEVRAELERAGGVPEGVRVVHAPHVVPDGGHPAAFMRAHPDNSISVAARLAAEGEADATLSVGHTGGCVVAASWHMGLLPGIDRPTAGVHFPFAPKTVLLDLGLNPEPKPHQLFQFAVLGAAYARIMLDVPQPTVALLSNGTEPGKGTDTVRRAYELLKRSHLRFAGYVEGIDVVANKVNVIVTDGFTGNVMIKFLEGLSMWIGDRIRQLADHAALSQLRSLLSDLDRMTDVTQGVDGIAVLGVNGIFVPGHGRARASAIANLILGAVRMVRRDFVNQVRQELLRATDALA